jgi:phospholipase C
MDFTRRQAIVAGITAGAGVYGEGLRRALAMPPACAASLDAIEHVVFFIQENRSFDHYFGSYRGVRGFSDARAVKLTDGSGLPVFAQPGYTGAGYGGHLYPFHLDVRANGECVHDVTHEWGPQHRSWNNGRMDGFVREHLVREGADGPITMGYHARADLPYYYALADAFTICDAYHCSAMGPSAPNHLHFFSGTLDPDGRQGGPVITHLPAGKRLGWTTMPEQLRARRISWKVYAADRNSDGTTNSVASVFAQYFTDPDLNARGLRQRFPEDFQADVAAGRLPQVSWIFASGLQSEHPPASILWGQHANDFILHQLTSRPELWARTVMFTTWDENGGFFDHVPPLTPPGGTRGEYLTVSPLPPEAEGAAGPIGLGFRVPLLIASPFTRGGFVCSDRFDHTSLLRFLETRFGARIPNLSAWRRSVTGDLTSAFNFREPPNYGVPRLPPTSLDALSANCVAQLNFTGPPPYPVPPNSVPAQEPGAPRRPSGCVPKRLRFDVSPHAIRAGRRVRIQFHVTTRVTGGSAPVVGAVITLAGRRVRTGKHGRAAMTVRFVRPGKRRATVTSYGYSTASVLILVRRITKKT